MRHLATTFLTLVVLAALAASAVGVPLDAPVLTWQASGSGKIELLVAAGATGCPEGFTMWWMRESDFQANGGQWYLYGNALQGECWFVGQPTLNVEPGEPGTFALGPNQSITIQIGDIADESGIVSYSLEELVEGTDYVFCTFANAGGGFDQSPYSQNIAGTTILYSANCTYTIGYWKNHPSAWPVTSLTLGTVTYTQAELLAILNQPTQGNGLVSMAKQLIAAKLNVAAGANSGSVASAIAAADAQIGGLVVPPVGAGYLAPSTTSAKTETLDDYNNGVTGPGHCGGTNATEGSTWGRVKGLYH
jgi:hypothetical protein